jgi:hypothetical protein
VGMLSCFGGMEKKKGSDWETVGALGARFSPLHPQYDCFLAIGDGIGELLELL